MIDLAMDRGGVKDSENAPNSFFPKINRNVFWRLGTEMSVLNGKSTFLSCLPTKLDNNLHDQISYLDQAFFQRLWGTT